MTKSDPSRRRFLEVVASAGASTLGVVACGAPAGVEPEPVHDVSVGAAASYAVGSLEAVGTLPVALGRDGKGFYAMTLTCPHQGCNMAIDGNVGATGVYCSCHGSRFDANGNVQQGPARDPLAHFAVALDTEGNVTIHGDQRVGSGTRTPA